MHKTRSYGCYTHISHIFRCVFLFDSFSLTQMAYSRQLYHSDIELFHSIHFHFSCTRLMLDDVPYANTAQGNNNKILKILFYTVESDTIRIIAQTWIDFFFIFYFQFAFSTNFSSSSSFAIDKLPNQLTADALSI